MTDINEHCCRSWAVQQTRKRPPMQKKRTIKIVGMVFLILFCLISLCAAEVVDRIVAIVNDEVITLTELNQELLPYVEKINRSDYPREKKDKIVYQLKQDMLDRMIDRMLTDQEVARIGITVSENEVDTAIERLKQSQFMTQEDLEKALAHDGVTYQEYREKIHQEILRPKLINYSVKSKVVVTDTDIEAYYHDHKALYTAKKKYHLYNILISFDRSGGSKSALFEKAQKIREMLDRGDSFKELAETYSQAPNASEGGDLGILEADHLSDTLKQKISKLKEKEYSDVIETEQGFQLFYVEDIQSAGVKKFEDVKEEIAKTLYDEIVEKKFNSWLDSLRENSHIKKML